MEWDEFWKLIEKTRDESDGDLEKQMTLLTDTLVNMPTAAILDYQRIHDELHGRAYRHELWNAAYLIGEGCGDDGFMDFRAWLIAQGQSVYENALRDPDTLAEVVSDKERYDTQFEGFLYVAADAYEQKTGTGDAMPVDRNFTEISGAHPLTEEEEDLERLYPKLWAKFGW